MKLQFFALLGVALLSACSASEPTADEPAPGDTVSLDGMEWCELTDRDEQPGECARLNRQYEALAAGIDAFETEESMTESRTAVVTYAITRLPESVQGERGELAEAVDEETVLPDGEPSPTGPTQEEIDTAMTEAVETVTDIVADDAQGAAVETGRIKVARLMYACLEGPPSFRIEPDGCQTLDTLERPDAVWRWEVTPTEPGENFVLLLRSGIEVRASDGSVRRIGNSGRRAEIDVKVTALGRWKRFLAAAEEWIRSPIGMIAALTALVLALGGLRRAWRNVKSGKAPEESDEAAGEDGEGGTPG